MKKLTIVCVDDEPRILNSLKMLFKREYNVLTTTGGNEAIDYLKNEKVHVIISDQRMPKMTGVEVLKRASQISPNTIRILLTGYSDLAAIVDSINEGEIYRYINKPWSNGQVKRLIGGATSISEGLWKRGPTEQQLVSGANAFNGIDLPKTGVLILDQEDTARSLLSKTVTCMNQSLFWVKTIEEALTLLETENVGVVIADINCGRDNVIEFINILKAEHPLIMTIVLTELTDFSSIVSLINQGQIFRYLPKPVVVNKLESQLASAIKRHHHYAKRPDLLKQHSVEKHVVPELNDAPLATTMAEKGKVSIGQRLVQRIRGLRARFGY